MSPWTATALKRLSTSGLLVGTLFFAASLTPSLVPRPTVLQGVLSGCSFAVGYLLGTLAGWVWHYLELPELRTRKARAVKIAAGALCASIAVVFLWRATEWQNSIRNLMDMEPVETARPLMVGLIAAGMCAALLVLARLFQIVVHLSAQRLKQYIPPRVANALGLAAAVLLFWSVVDGVVFRYGLQAVDASFQRFDAAFEDNVAKPLDPSKTGSEASLIAWEDLGRRGRQYVSLGPSAETIGAIRDRPAMEPLRVYVGLNSAETVEARAQLALEEMVRVGAFDRSVLAIVTPTGTGWVDPGAMDSLEYLHDGDVASVAVQYSYLASWLSLLLQPGYGADTARALFDAVYGYWTTLPPDNRPELYLHGLSLGALNSDLSADLYDIIADPYQGALWSGPPFSSRTWQTATGSRLLGSPAWLPRFRDGSIIRFTNQEDQLDIPGAEWGPTRIVYLQYASDPVTFFDPRSFYREPDWLTGRRGPDVSPELQWFPVVTMLQLGIDIAAATLAPVGYGHIYAPEDYVDAWLEITDPDGWSDQDVRKLKQRVMSFPALPQR